MSKYIIGFAIAGVVLFAQNFLCTKFKNPLWGGIIPILTLAGTIYVFARGILPLEEWGIFLFVILNLSLVSSWINGRKKYRKIQQAEIEKMKAKEL